MARLCKIGELFSLYWICSMLSCSSSAGGNLAGPSNEPAWTGGWTNIVPANHVSQSFIAKSNLLSRIEVGITTGNAQYGDDSLTLLLHDNQGNLIYSGTQLVNTGYDGWLMFDTASIAINTGEIYQIEMNDTGKVTFGWKYSADSYPDGTAYFQGSPDATRDYYFRINP